MSRINNRIEKLEKNNSVVDGLTIDCASLAAEIFASLPIPQVTLNSTEDTEGVNNEEAELERVAGDPLIVE